MTTDTKGTMPTQDWTYRGRRATQLEMIPGEQALALDALPQEADAAECISIIEEVHDEATAALMFQGDVPTKAQASVRSIQSAGVYESRPRSGLADAEGV